MPHLPSAVDVKTVDTTTMGAKFPFRSRQVHEDPDPENDYYTGTPSTWIRQVLLRYVYDKTRENDFMDRQVTRRPLPAKYPFGASSLTTIAEIARTSTDDLGVCTMTVAKDPYLYRFPNTNVYFPRRPMNGYFLFDS